MNQNEGWFFIEKLLNPIHRRNFKMKKFQKTILAALMIVLVAGFAPLMVQANQDISVTIDGVQVAFPDQLPVIIDGRTLVPVGGVFGALGFVPTWDGDAQTATLSRSDFTVIITIGNDIFTTNGAEFILDVPAQIIEGRTMLPLRAVLESIEISPANIGWNEETRAITIVTDGNVSDHAESPPGIETPVVDEDQEEDYQEYEDEATDEELVALIQQTFNAYAAKLREATPVLIAEFLDAADGLDMIADLIEWTELSTYFSVQLADILYYGIVQLTDLAIEDANILEIILMYTDQLFEIHSEESSRFTQGILLGML